MFIVVQIPMADLRPLVQGEAGRLSLPDWTAVDAGNWFVRGFGKISERNDPVEGALGERFYATFNQALRYRAPLRLKEKDWPGSLLVVPWFRRFYYDGLFAGRFEFGFVIEDALEDNIFSGDGVTPYDPRKIAQALNDLPVLVRSVDGSESEETLWTCGEALGLAYLAATTSHAKRAAFAPAETYGHFLKLGRPIVHIRASNYCPVATTPDRREVLEGPEGLFITSADQSALRHAVIVQQSNSGAFEEPARERAIRVLFASLNAAAFASSHFLDAHKRIDLGPADLREAVGNLVTRFKGFKPSGPEDKTDDDFGAALRTFSAAYANKQDLLLDKLQALAAQAQEPTALERALDYGWEIFDLFIKTLVKEVPKEVIKNGLKSTTG